MTLQELQRIKMAKDDAVDAIERAQKDLERANQLYVDARSKGEAMCDAYWSALKAFGESLSK